MRRRPPRPLRRGLPRADAPARSAGVAHRAALLQRSGLYRGAGLLDPGELSRLAVPAGSRPRLVSRHPEGICRQGRSLSARIASRPCGCCASGSGSTRTKLMLTFQSRFGRAQWLEPYTDKTVKSLAKTRREESRGHHAGLLRRLPRDARGDRGRERAISSR